MLTWFLKCSSSPQLGLLYLVCAGINLSSLEFLPTISKLLYEEKKKQVCKIVLFEYLINSSHLSTKVSYLKF